MSARPQIRVVENEPAVAKSFHRTDSAPRRWTPVVIEGGRDTAAGPSEPRGSGPRLNYFLLFVAAVFFALGYAIVLPALALGLTAWLLSKTLSIARIVLLGITRPQHSEAPRGRSA